MQFMFHEDGYGDEGRSGALPAVVLEEVGVM